MAWTDPYPKLTHDVRTDLLPLPVLLQNLRLLTMPTQELIDTVVQELGDNPIYEINPPRNWQESWELNDIPATPSIEENLIRQMAQCPMLRKERDSLSAELVMWLDHRGFLSADEEEIAKEIGLPIRKLEILLDQIRSTVTPPGIFAKDLVHCLAIQLRRSGRADGDGAELLRKAGDLMKKGDMSGAMEIMGWSRKRFDSAIEELSGLDPSPGREAKAPTVIPEIALFPDPGRPVVLLAENLPKISMLPVLWEDRRIISMRDRGIRLMEALARRNAAKITLGMCLAKRQKEYLTEGLDAPYPLTMTEIAQELERSISTVQRLASTTWATTRFGTIPLSGLFSRPLRSRPDMSVAQLRLTIKESIEKGLSDAELSRILGIPRRTITWHRLKT